MSRTNRMSVSAQRCLMKCPRKFEIEYVRRWQPETTALELLIGTAFHEFLNARRKGLVFDPEALYEAMETYEQARVSALVIAYQKHYENDDLVFKGSEVEFNKRLFPRSRTLVHGFIDGLAEMDGKLYLVENKTTSDDISPESDYWLRLRHDPQIHAYAWACPKKTYGVIYDVVRKPALRVNAIPQLDELGLKIVIDQATGERAINKNGTPRQSGGEGYEVLSRPEEPFEYCQRMVDAMLEEPDKYFARREVPVLSDGIERWLRDMFAADDLARSMHSRRYYPRNIDRWTCGMCPHQGLCLANGELPAAIPAGYKERK